MSGAELAARLEMDPSALLRLEQSERQRRIQLNTLDRVAQALDCEVAYALVPRRPLDAVVDERARQLARQEVLGVDHTMALEDQRVDNAWVDQRIETVAEQLKIHGRLWAKAGGR